MLFQADTPAYLAWQRQGARSLLLPYHLGSDVLARAGGALGAEAPEEGWAGGGVQVQLHMQVGAGGIAAQAL